MSIYTIIFSIDGLFMLGCALMLRGVSREALLGFVVPEASRDLRGAAQASGTV